MSKWKKLNGRILAFILSASLLFAELPVYAFAQNINVDETNNSSEYELADGASDDLVRTQKEGTGTETDDAAGTVDNLELSDNTDDDATTDNTGAGDADENGEDSEDANTVVDAEDAESDATGDTETVDNSENADADETSEEEVISEDDTVTEEALDAGTKGTMGSLNWEVKLNDDATTRTLYLSPIEVNTNVSMGNYTSEAAYAWYVYNESITKVVIKDGITDVGKRAFYGYRNLETVEIADSVTVIKESAFERSYMLKNVNFPSNLEEIGNSAFWQTYLEEAILPNGLKRIGDAAFGSTAIRKISIPASLSFIGEGAFKSYELFRQRGDITGPYITITVDSGNPYFKAENNILYSKDGKSLYLYGVNSSDTFYVPYGVEIIEKYAFAYVKSLTDVRLSDSVREIREGAFEGCNGLTYLWLNDGLTTIEGSAFDYADNVILYNVPKRLSEYPSALFKGIANPEAIFFDDMTVIPSMMYADNENLIKAVIPQGITEIGSYAFFGCKYLETVVIPSSVTKINKFAFDKCLFMKDVYYGGSQQEWLELLNTMVNPAELSSKNIHFYKSEVTITIKDEYKDEANNELIPGVKLSDIEFTSDDSVVNAINVTQWLNEYDVSIPNNSLTETGKFYWAFMNMTAAPGFSFNEYTAVSINGQKCEVIDVNSNGTVISFIMPLLKTACIHKKQGNTALEWKYDLDNHWQECSLCGLKKEVHSHLWGPETLNNGISVYECTAEGCNAKKEMASNQRKITNITIDTYDYGYNENPPFFYAPVTGDEYSSLMEVYDVEWYKGSINPSNKLGEEDKFGEGKYYTRFKIRIKETYEDRYYIPEDGLYIFFRGTQFGEEAGNNVVNTVDGKRYVQCVYSYNVEKHSKLDIIVPDYFEGISFKDFNDGLKLKVNNTAVTPMAVTIRYANTSEALAGWLFGMYTPATAENFEIEKNVGYAVSVSVQVPGYIGINDLNYVSDYYKGMDYALDRTNFIYDSNYNLSSVNIYFFIEYEPDELDEAGVIVEAPLIGEKFLFKAKTVSDEIKVTNVKWRKVNSDNTFTDVSSTDVPELNGEYECVVSVKTAGDYAISSLGTHFTVNGFTAEASNVSGGVFEIRYRFRTISDHEHVIEEIPVKWSTCKEPGHIAYLKCTACGRCYYLICQPENKIEDIDQWLNTLGSNMYGGMSPVNPENHDFIWPDGEEGPYCVGCNAYNIGHKNFDTRVEVKNIRYDQNPHSSMEAVSITGLNAFIDYFIEDIDNYGSFTEPGTYRAIIKGNGSRGYGGQRMIEFSVIPDEGQLWAQVEGEYVYTGNVVKPKIKVYCGDKLLVKNKDYTVKYKNNIKAAKATDINAPTIIITGKGNYSGKKKINFTIKPIDFQGEHLVDNIAVAYTGNNISLIPTKVIYAGKTLQYGKDFVVVDENNQDSVMTFESAESVTGLKIKGQGNYFGLSEAFTFTITREKLLKKCNIVVSDAQYNDGFIAKPVITITKDGVTLVEGTDYIVEYCGSNTEVGKGKLRITAITGSGYAGSVNKQYKIRGVAISQVNVAAITAQEYTGKAIMPLPVIIYAPKNGNQVTLRKDIDYSIQYKKNINVGTAVIIVKGMGRYTGSTRVTFKIIPFNVKTNNSNWMNIVSYQSAIYQKGGTVQNVTVTFRGEYLRNGVDYKISYANNKGCYPNPNNANQKQPSLTVTFMGNYSGTYTRKFDIVRKDLTNGLNVVIANNYYSSAPNAWKTNKIIVKDTNGNVLVKGTDYTVKYYSDSNYTQEFTAADYRIGATVYVRISEATNKNYYNWLDRKYVIKKADMSDVDIQNIVVPYTGSYIYIDKTDLIQQNLISYNGVPLSVQDIEIVPLSHLNNLNVGKASFEIRGIGECTGTRRVSFKIAPYDVRGYEANFSVKTTQVYYSYSSEGAKPLVIVEDTINHIQLVNGRDYTLSYVNNKTVADDTAANPPTVRVKLKGNYKGVLTKTFSIKKVSMSAYCEVNIPDAVWKSKENGWNVPVKKVKVMDASNGYVLKPDVDFDTNFEYYQDQECTMPFNSMCYTPQAEVFVKIKAKNLNRYDGFVVGKFRVVQESISNCSIVVADKKYTGTPITFDDLNINLNDIIIYQPLGNNRFNEYNGSDEGYAFRIVPSSFKKNINKGTGSFVIEGMGPLKGRVTVTFKIVSKNVGESWWDYVFS